MIRGPDLSPGRPGKGGDALKKRRHRSFGFYNIKGLLVFLVVFGHLLEPQTGGVVSFLYLVIYSFHMPAFIFLSGWFSRTSTIPRSVTGVLLPYLLFQLAYLLYTGQPIQFLSPYWILWYLMALFLWRLLVPLLRKSEKVTWALFPVAVAASLLCGYAPWIGYDLALSRVLVFLPYFLMGFAMTRRREQVLPVLKTRLSRYLSLAAVLCTAVYLWRVRLTFQRPWTFGASCYEHSGATPAIRLLLLFIALLWIWFLLAWMTERKVRGLTVLGRNTLFVYLLHGFVKIQVDAHAEALYHFGTFGNILLAFLLAGGLCILFGNRWLAGCWRWLMEAWRYFLREIKRR